MYAWSNDNETDAEPTQSELELYDFTSPSTSNSTVLINKWNSDGTLKRKKFHEYLFDFDKIYSEVREYTRVFEIK